MWFPTLTARNRLEISASQWNTSPIYGKVGSAVTLKSLSVLFKLDDWNDVEIIAKGSRLQHYLNGTLILDCTDNHPELALREGVLALQLHAGKPMWAEFKDISIQHLPGDIRPE